MRRQSFVLSILYLPLNEIGQFQALLLPCHQIARAYHIKDCKLQKNSMLYLNWLEERKYTLSKKITIQSVRVLADLS